MRKDSKGKKGGWASRYVPRSFSLVRLNFNTSNYYKFQAGEERDRVWKLEPLIKIRFFEASLVSKPLPD